MNNKLDKKSIRNILSVRYNSMEKHVFRKATSKELNENKKLS